MNSGPLKHIELSEIPQTGIPEIDAQHAELVVLYNRLYEWVERGQAISATFDAVTALESYVAKHFAYEEKFLKQIGFEELEEHLARHIELISEFGRYKQTLFDGEDVTNQLLGFVSNWIRTHISLEDMKYARHYHHIKYQF